uniref:ATP-dependent DNA helicase n=1 Tax=Globodera pallida TaxID=36090 RepID=A0A183BHX0_GLOPA
MFAVWTETERPPAVSGIWITTAEGDLTKFPPYHPLTDTLCYPLLIPCGDDGYHNSLTIKKPKKRRNSRPIEDDDLALDITKKRSKILPIDDEDDLPTNMDVEDYDSESMTDSEATDSDTSMDLQSDDGSTDQTTKMSLRSFVKYRMAIREGQQYHFIWSAAGGLSQKLILDYSARIDADIANFLRRPELDLRGTLPEHLLRWFARNAGLSSVEEIGSVVLFRKTQPGTRAYFQDMYYDATTIMARIRQPRNACFMLTWTCNPHWPEIKRNFLRVGQKVVDRFDILCRVYEDKLRHVHELLDKKNIFGKQLGFAESREFQKRIGGPHLHRIFQSTILALPENIENVIWAHIPAEPLPSDTSNWANFMRKVRELIQKYQLHDCGSHCRNLKGKCSKGFPKPFSKHTILFDDKPAVYRRPSPEDGGETLTVKRKKATIVYDNSRVVPFNPFLLVLTETHHNLEYAYGKSTNLKYALKYEFKGASFSYVKSTEENKTNVDEPAFYAKMLYRSPVEAFSRIMSYRYACLSHTVYALSIHLPGKQKLYVRPGQNAKEVAEQLLNNEIQLPETPLTAYWKQWRADPALQNVLFEKMPEKYSFDKLLKIWKKRKISTDPKKMEKRRPILGRIYPILPRAQELFALYILTKHFPGDPDHLKNVNGHQCETFLEAARLRGLIKDSNVWIRTLEEGAASLNPAQMRQLFASILLFGNTEGCVIDGLMLWNRFLCHMYDPRCSDREKPLRIERALCLLERIFVMQGRQCSDFGLPTPQNSIINNPELGVNDFFFPQHLADDDVDETVDTSTFGTAQLNEEQKQFFDKIQKVLSVSPNNPAKRLFFLSGDGGTGKTFLLNYLLFRMRQMGKKVIATASTGMAATRFYAGGTTVHAAFRLGITVEPGKIPPITFDSFFGRRIIEAEVLIIDEITMLHKVVLENIDLICRTLIPRYAHLPFSGKIVILSGDWKQSLPVVSDSYCVEAQVAACVQSSPLYELFEKVKLVENMRVNQQDVEFISWLKKVGTGEFGETVPVPKEWIVYTRDELVASVFDHGFAQTSNELLKRLMLATTNRIVDLNNASILSTFNSEYKDYYSDDTPLNEGTFAVNAADFDVGQINLLSPSGMPAHQIRLKVGSIIVLLLNLNTSKALCNGTRLIVKKMTDNLIHAEALTVAASRSGIEVFIPRVSMAFKGKRPDDVNFERFQFPVLSSGAQNDHDHFSFLHLEMDVHQNVQSITDQRHFQSELIRVKKSEDSEPNVGTNETEI